MDAGMPTTADLTHELRQLLPQLPDVNGNIRSEFARLFDYIKEQDPPVAENYEQFFRWINLLITVQTDPFGKLIRLNLCPQFAEAMYHIPFVIGRLIKDVLRARKTESSYLARLIDFVPTRWRLKVFSLNYDCCLEDACRTAGLDVTTGFDSMTKKWDPSSYWLASKGINLYKLHGSLRWFPVRGKRELLELTSEDYQRLSKPLNVADEPEMVLGPGHKIQSDDLFLTLFHEFHWTLQRARKCVVIGYGFRDDHVNIVLERALDTGVSIIDENTAQPNHSLLWRGRYVHLPQSAKNALMNGTIQSELQKMSA